MQGEREVKKKKKSAPVPERHVSALPSLPLDLLREVLVDYKYCFLSFLFACFFHREGSLGGWKVRSLAHRTGVPPIFCFSHNFLLEIRIT